MCASRVSSSLCPGCGGEAVPAERGVEKSAKVIAFERGLSFRSGIARLRRRHRALVKGDTAVERVKVVFVKPDRAIHDGVMDYQANLIDALRKRPTIEVEEVALSLLSSLDDRAPLTIHLQLPVRAWRWDIRLASVLRRALAAGRDRQLAITLHEWGYSHPIRRAVQGRALALAEKIVVPSLELLREVNASRVVQARASSAIIPIAANVRLSARERLALPPVPEPLVLGSFGFLYAKKFPLRMLTILADLLSRGVEARLVHIGRFLRPGGALERAFRARAAELGLGDRVTVMGYLPPAQVKEEMARCSAFLSFHERGFSNRNGSALTALEFGVPVFVNSSTTDAAAEVANYSRVHGCRNLVEIDLHDPRSSSHRIHRALQASAGRDFPRSAPGWDTVAAAYEAFYSSRNRAFG